MTEADLYQNIAKLSKFKNKRDFIQRVNELKIGVLEKTDPLLVYRLGLEIEHRKQYKITLSDLEDHLIKIVKERPFLVQFLCSWAANIKAFNLEKIQDAVIASRQSKEIAEFALYITNSDFNRLQEAIIEIGKPVGADYLLRHFEDKADVERLCPILLKSKKPKYLLLLSFYIDDFEELDYIWELMLKTKSFHLIRQFWEIHGEFLDLEPFEEKVLKSNSDEEIKKTYYLTKSRRLARYVLLM